MYVPVQLYLLLASLSSMLAPALGSSVYYISFMEPLVESSTVTATATDSESDTSVQYLYNVSQGDDSPNELVRLPWKFMFFGTTIDKVYVNPNGAVLATPLPPCGML